MSSVYATRAAADPAVAKSYGTSVSNGTKLYNGDVLTLTGTPASGYVLTSNPLTVTISTPSPTSSSSRESNYYTGDYNFGAAKVDKTLSAPTLSKNSITVKANTFIDADCTNSNSIAVTAHYGQDSSCSSTVEIPAGSTVNLYRVSTKMSALEDVYVYCYFTDADVGEYEDSSMSSMLYKSAGSSGDTPSVKA